MHARIMTAVRASAPAKKAFLNVWKIAPTGAVALLLMFLVLQQKHQTPNPSVATKATTGGSRERGAGTKEGAAEPKKWKIASFEVIEAIEAPSIPVQQPLETEMANLQSDTINAARALVESFLPASFGQ